jgi:hypothetical protein
MVRVMMLKCDEKFLYVLLTQSQEQNIQTGRFSMIYADEVVVSHTNENEYNSFVGNKKSAEGLAHLDIPESGAARLVAFATCFRTSYTVPPRPVRKSAVLSLCPASERPLKPGDSPERHR